MENWGTDGKSFGKNAFADFEKRVLKLSSG